MNRGKYYLGDGAYAEDDGFQFRIFCQREGGEHEVYLDSQALQSFIRFIERSRDVTITIKPNPKVDGNPPIK